MIDVIIVFFVGKVLNYIYVVGFILVGGMLFGLRGFSFLRFLRFRVYKGLKIWLRISRDRVIVGVLIIIILFLFFFGE